MLMSILHIDWYSEFNFARTEERRVELVPIKIIIGRNKFNCQDEFNCREKFNCREELIMTDGHVELY